MTNLPASSNQAKQRNHLAPRDETGVWQARQTQEGLTQRRKGAKVPEASLNFAPLRLCVRFQKRSPVSKPFVPAPVLLIAVCLSMISLSSCDKKPADAPQAAKPATEDPKASWRNWIEKSTDQEWWKQQGAKASDAAKAIKESLDSINAEEVKKQANEIVKAIESQDVSKVEAVAGELGKHLSIEKLTEGLRFVVIQRQKGGEAAAKAIDEYAARPNLNEFEKIAAQNLKAGLSIAQRDDVRGLIAGAIFFACESKLGGHRGGFLAVPIISILFPEFYEKHDRKLENFKP